MFSRGRKKTNQQKKIGLHWYTSKIQENIGRLSKEWIHTNQVNRILLSPIINLALTLKEWGSKIPKSKLICILSLKKITKKPAPKENKQDNSDTHVPHNQREKLAQALPIDVRQEEGLPFIIHTSTSNNSREKTKYILEVITPYKFVTQ